MSEFCCPECGSDEAVELYYGYCGELLGCNSCVQREPNDLGAFALVDHDDNCLSFDCPVCGAHFSGEYVFDRYFDRETGECLGCEKCVKTDDADTYAANEEYHRERGLGYFGY